MSKRSVGKYAVAATATGIYALAVAECYKKLGSEPEANDMTKFKRVIVAASMMTGLTWLATAL